MTEAQAPGTVALRVSRKALPPALIALASIAGLAFLSPDQRSVALPALAIVNVFAVAFAMLWARDGAPPLFDIGVVCLGFTSVYVILPLAQYLLSGMEWTIFSDGRLYQHNPSAGQLGAFAWLPAIYIVALASSYTLTRGKTGLLNTTFKMPNHTTVVAIVALFVIVTSFFISLDLFFGIRFNQPYSEVGTAIATGAVEQLPLLFRQMTNHLMGMLMVLKIALLLLIIRKWEKRLFRYALVLWLLAETVAVGSNMGARTSVVFLLIGAGLAYHRFVRSFRVRVAAALVIIVVAGALIYGFVRDYRGNMPLEADRQILSAANEFQVLYGTPYDLLKRKSDGSLPPIPWQLYASDLLMLLPQQILPVEKIDPGVWYLEVLGLRGTGLGLMFGVLSQAVIGWGALELVLRGAFLGFLLGAFHRWYVSRSLSFWPTVLYLWLCIWSYYTYRATTFYVLTFIMYRFLPVFVIVSLVDLAAKARLTSNTAGADGAPFGC